MPKRKVDKFSDARPFVEYAHVVGYYAQTPRYIARSAIAIARQLEQTLGESRVGVVAHTSQTHRPDWRWERRADAWLLNVHTDGVSQAEALGLGDIQRLDSLLFVSNHYGAKEKAIDYNWCVSAFSEGDFPHQHFDADLVTTVRMNLFDDDNTGRRQSRDLIDSIVEVTLQVDDLYYLLVDVAEYSLTGAAGIYQHQGGPTLQPTALVRAIERQLWEQLGKDRRNRLRGVFWGNYLNPTVLGKLGGREQFGARFREMAKNAVLNYASLFSETPDGGAMVKISRDPMDESARHGVCHLGEEIAVWLYKEFRRAGLLI